MQNKWNIDYIVTFRREKIKRKSSKNRAQLLTGQKMIYFGEPYVANLKKLEMC